MSELSIFIDYHYFTIVNNDASHTSFILNY